MSEKLNENLIIANLEDFTAVANAIRAKSGVSASLSFPTGMVNAISNIQGGGSGDNGGNGGGNVNIPSAEGVLF